MSTNFSANQIIQKKRDGHALSHDEINWFIKGLTAEKVPDYQMTALLMAIYLNGFNVKETASLTSAMLFSGKILSFNDKTVIDKHSTGGIGDKTSFILAPIAKALGVKVPMIAGRGLGHTGGTIDKIEAIEGFQTSLSLKEFEKRVKEDGIVLIGQTKDIAPADKKIYALRDVTGTVESIPLITASIMSKKLAEGSEGIVMDVKVGSGAFMSSMANARKLAKSLRNTATDFDKKMLTMITDMNQPLGNTIGNSLEIIESIETLKSNGPKDLTSLSCELAGAMAYLAGKFKTHKKATAEARKVLKNGLALNIFRELIRAQGGNEKVVDDTSLLPMSACSLKVKSSGAGFIKSINGKALGLHIVTLGGGRSKASDIIDFGVGITLNKKVGDKVKENETLLTIHYNKGQEAEVKEIEKHIASKDIKISKMKPKKMNPLIFEVDQNF